MRILVRRRFTQHSTNPIARLNGEIKRRTDVVGKRAYHLLSCLVRCKCCGGPFTVENRDRMICSNHKNKGICGVDHSNARKDVEKRVLDAIVTKLSDPEILGVYRDEYLRERKEKLASATVSSPTGRIMSQVLTHHRAGAFASTRSA